MRNYKIRFIVIDVYIWSRRVNVSELALKSSLPSNATDLSLIETCEEFLTFARSEMNMNRDAKLWENILIAV